MKTLTLLRHAKSSWDDTVERDFDRPVNGRGRRAAARIGRWIGDERLSFDHVVASPAVRVRQTIEGVEDGLGSMLQPLWDTRIYLSSAATLMLLAQQFSDAKDDALLVGHNPGCEDLLLMLVPPGSGPLRDEAEIKYPTATLARIELDIARWADLDDNKGRLSHFIRPRDLDPTLGPDD
ncbi:SixA phosphatase family protein [Glacieibacterium frigidum]|uniref:Histidine phosphatase family protein n=1 Tax=Glacieibacterium frigidum TaxID=2593303 RepID=A0A552UFY4_9SPHN|nr:histidine phosphatase family protein [Glacieibacterium frigidum]TRW17133.1 histidine phosphatase family protein [Glacieibacterium frigidum]